MIHDHALMNHYDKYDQKVHIQVCKFTVWPATCFDFRDMFFEGCITRNVKVIEFTNMKCRILFKIKHFLFINSIILTFRIIYPAKNTSLNMATTIGRKA
jgi:hypothetical protein